MNAQISDSDQVAKFTLWDFAISVYKEDGVSTACLFLQESCDVDVPLLLCSGFLVFKGKSFDATILRNLQNQSRGWQREVVQSLRAVRQNLKLESYPVPTSEKEELRVSVKAAELSAEKIQLSMMETATAPVPSTDVQLNPTNLTAALKMVVTAHCKTAFTPEQLASIELIADAIMAQKVTGIQPDPAFDSQ